MLEIRVVLLCDNGKWEKSMHDLNCTEMTL